MSLTPIDRPSPNHDARRDDRGIDILLLHYTGMQSAEAALARLCDPAAAVSAHYLIDEEGSIYQLVPEARRAWHAGVACWTGESDINGCSIGIELVNPGHEFGYRDFPEAQLATLQQLCLEILARHPIPPNRVLGHSDVAPLRKEDPGERFPWRRLAQAGIGIWPEAQADRAPLWQAAEIASALSGLGYGYVEDDLAAVIRAFQRRYRPACIDGVADAETIARLQALLGSAGISA